jgi:hypothetical protein
LLYEILEAVRDSSDDSLAQIVSLVRSNASVEEAKRCIKEMLGEIRSGQREASPELEKVQNQLKDRPRRALFNINRLIDQPPIEVEADPWTEITNDSTLISHLVSVFMVWVNPFYNWIHEELFLRDMRAKILGASYCSPFLVNALLASACLYSDYDETRADKGVLSELEKDFREEARRLLQDMDATESASITTVQGLLYLYMSFSLHEGDGTHMHYLTDAFQRCENLDRTYTPSEDGKESEFQEALNVTCWGTYNLAATLSHAYQGSVQMAVPTRPRPTPRADAFEPSPYALTAASEPCHTRSLLYHRCDLSMAFQRYADTLYGSKNSSAKEKVHKLRELQEMRAQQRQALPPYLRLSSGSTQSVLLIE